MVSIGHFYFAQIGHYHFAPTGVYTRRCTAAIPQA
jgi:hypothetical protein